MFKPVCRQAARQLVRPARSAVVGRRYAHTPAVFDWKDPLGASNLYTEEELAIAETAESYCQERMLPRVLGVRTLSRPHYFDQTFTDYSMQRHTGMKSTTRRS